MQWIASNWQAVLSILSMLLGVGVAVSHILHKDSVAAQLENLENMIKGISGSSASAAPSAPPQS